ncbi:MAG: hypothetical protein P9L97_06785 [Candidatus Tenebribacter davisii]|jgi:hypothetical protein|nr:hypothetical protein [Candidatus Tenebribacter davisii]
MEKRKPLTNAISDFLNKNATWYFILILLGLILLFNLLIFPLFYTTNPNIILLDLQLSYSSEEAYNILAKYNDEELKEYIIGELTVELIYPIVYTLFFSFFIFKLSKKNIFSFLPLLIMFSDYFENIGIVTIINYYPQKLPNIVTLTSLFTSLKWILVAISILLILVLLITKLYKQKKDT